MAKREFIETREIVYVNAPIAPILQGDSIHYEDIAFKSQIGRIHSFSEQDIVKPVLDKIREEVESIEHYGTNNGNDFWLRTPDEIKKDVLAILDKYMSESAVYITKAFDTLAGVVMKYQKIQEIVKLWREVGLDYDSCDAMENIERVIDNGNDN